LRTISAILSACAEDDLGGVPRRGVLRRILCRVELAQEHLGVGHHARERLVELVRRGARELGDDGLPLLREDLVLRLLELLLHAHLLAKVGEDADGPDRHFPLVDERRRQEDRDALTRCASTTSVRKPLDAPAASANQSS
jgi:hypothetical protein